MLFCNFCHASGFTKAISGRGWLYLAIGVVMLCFFVFCAVKSSRGNTYYDLKGPLALFGVVMGSLFLLNGIRYVRSGISKCPICDSTDVIPVESPRAREMLSKKNKNNH